ncbi:MAG: hypothetical protein ACRDIE_21120 [Chloroflexota bacterium]
MKWKYRWSLLVIIPFILATAALATAAGLSRARATATPNRTAIVAHVGRSVTISVAPGRADAENTFIVEGIRASAVRILSRSLDMRMGTTSYAAGRLGEGQWRIVNAEVPMVGRWGIEVQAQRDGAWTTVGKIAYYVPFTGMMHQLARPENPGRIARQGRTGEGRGQPGPEVARFPPCRRRPVPGRESRYAAIDRTPSPDESRSKVVALYTLNGNKGGSVCGDWFTGSGRRY